MVGLLGGREALEREVRVSPVLREGDVVFVVPVFVFKVFLVISEICVCEIDDLQGLASSYHQTLC